MTTIEHTAPAAAVPAMPPRFRGWLPLVPYIRRARENLIAIWPEEAYEQDFIARRFLFRSIFIANNPDAAQHVLQTNADNYVKSMITRRLLGPGLGQGLLLSEGTLWRRQRRIVTPAFRHERVRALDSVMTAASRDMLARWDELADGTELDMAREMMRFTLDIVCRTMFSSDIEAEAEEIGACVSRYQDTVGRISIPDLLGLPGWLPRLGARQARDAIRREDAILRDLIGRRRARGAAGDDLLAMLLEARDEETGEGMSENQLLDEVATIMNAGHETTANALVWTWYLLAGHPAVEARLHDELTEALADRIATADDLPALPYTRMVIEESMRLYPPAHTISREALADDEICGHHIPAGSTVMVLPWLLHRHKALWADPDAFDPGRFAPERADERPRYAYIPFGGGPRICLGASFAMKRT